MSSIKAFSVWLNLTSIAHKFCILPFKRQGNVIIAPPQLTLSYISFCSNSFKFLLYLVLIICRAAQEYTQHENSFFARVQLLSTVITGLLNTINFIIILHNFKLYAGLSQAIATQLQRHRDQECTQMRRKHVKKFSRLLAAIAFVCMITPCITALKGTSDLDSPTYMTRLFFHIEDAPIWIKIVFKCLHVYLSMWIDWVLSFNLMAVICFNLGTIKLLPCCGSLSPPEAARIYKELTLIVDAFNQIFCYFIWAIQILGIVASVICIYVGTVSRSLPYSLQGLLCVVIVKSLFENLSGVSQASDRVLQNWKSKRQDKWLRRAIKSCKPLRMRVGSLYYIDVGLVLTFFDIVITYAVNLILTFPA